MITLNIGLARNDGEPDNSLGRTLACLSSAVRHEYVLDARTAQSSTERTLVVQLSGWDRITRHGLEWLCGELAQDCVAVRYDDESGELIGPNAAKWGEFNPKYFIDF